jgi:hypothetical protein
MYIAVYMFVYFIFLENTMVHTKVTPRKTKEVFLNTWLQTSHVNCVISLTHWRRCVFSCSSLEKSLLHNMQEAISVNVEDLAQGSGTSRPRRKIRSPERYGDFVYK